MRTIAAVTAACAPEASARCRSGSHANPLSGSRSSDGPRSARGSRTPALAELHPHQFRAQRRQCLPPCHDLQGAVRLRGRAPQPASRDAVARPSGVGVHQALDVPLVPCAGLCDGRHGTAAERKCPGRDCGDTGGPEYHLSTMTAASRIVETPSMLRDGARWYFPRGLSTLAGSSLNKQPTTAGRGKEGGGV